MSDPAECLYHYKALLLPWTVHGLEDFTRFGTSWHDGDTCNVLVSTGMHGYELIHLRPAGYNAPETNGDTKAAGDAARAYVAGLVDTGGIVYVNSIEFTHDQEGSFGRMLGVVTLADGRDLATLMIESGHAVPDPG